MHERAWLLLVGLGSTTESALKGLLDAFEVVTLMRSAESGDAAIGLAVRSGVPVEGATFRFPRSVRSSSGRVPIAWSCPPITEFSRRTSCTADRS